MMIAHLMSFVLVAAAFFAGPVIVTCSSSTVYSLSKLANSGVSQPFTTVNESACAKLCTGNVSAVSYSRHSHQCVASTCANLQTIPDALWETFVCSKLINYLITEIYFVYS